MGRIFKIQAKNLHKFRRKTRRRLRKGDIIRIFGETTNSEIRELADLRPKTKDVLWSRKYTNTIDDTDSGKLEPMRVLEIGYRD